MSLAHLVGPQTRIIPMIGHPIVQVKSLAPINAWFAQTGVNACMAPVDVEPARVGAFFEFVRGWKNCVGVSITLPHKQAAFDACDRLSSRAQVARAVNIIRCEQGGLLYGDMTDGVAFCSEIARKGVTIEGASFLLIGAGGAGSAVAHAMAEQGASSMAVVDIDVQRRDALVSSLREHYRDLAIVDAASAASRADVALNATPMGMREDDPLPFALESLAPRALIADAVTKPSMTKWLKAAQARGHNIQTGEDMALAQLPVQLPFWGFDFAAN